MAIGDTSTADGYFKELYGELADAVPEYSILAERVPYAKRERLGDSYHFPVRLQRAHGTTFQGGASSMGAFTLNAVRSGKMLDASVSGSSFVARESFGYKAVLSASSNKSAFGDLFDEGVSDLMNTASFFREACMLYGGTDLGEVASESTVGTTQTVTLTVASSAMGLWSQMQGALVDIYAGAVKQNSTGAASVTSVTENASNQVVIVLELAAAGDAAAAADVLLPHGAYGQWFAGIDKILTNSASLFGIDAAANPLWKGNSHAAGSAALTMAKLQSAASKIVQSSGPGDLVALTSVKTFENLNSDVAGLRRYVEASNTAELGVEGIKYHYSGGTIEILPHICVKAGEAFVGSLDNIKRVGASDITFSLGVEGQQERFLRELADASGFEVRVMWDQACIIPKPRGWCKISGIVNS